MLVKYYLKSNANVGYFSASIIRIGQLNFAKVLNFGKVGNEIFFS